MHKVRMNVSKNVKSQDLGPSLISIRENLGFLQDS